MGSTSSMIRADCAGEILDGSMKKQSKQIAFGCIWCGKTPRTREHFWPQWISKIVPKTANNHQVKSLKEIEVNGKMETIPESHKAPGDLASRTLKVVCATCNGGWMSDIEDAAAPVMKRILTGDIDFEITVEDQVKLRDWIALKTFILETANRDFATLTASDREAFFTHRVAIRQWVIVIGRYKGSDWAKRVSHTGAAIYPLGDHNSKPNVQLSAFCIGNMFMCSISSEKPFTMKLNPKYGLWKTIIISPDPTPGANFAKLPLINDNEATQISYLLYTLNMVSKPYPA